MPTPDEVVTDALRAFEQRKSSFIQGFQNRVMAFFGSRLLPRRLVARMAGRMVSDHS